MVISLVRFCTWRTRPRGIASDMPAWAISRGTPAGFADSARPTGKPRPKVVISSTVLPLSPHHFTNAAQVAGIESLPRNYCEHAFVNSPRTDCGLHQVRFHEVLKTLESLHCCGRCMQRLRHPPKHATMQRQGRSGGSANAGHDAQVLAVA